MQKSKFLALLLAVAMVASMVVVPAYAAAPTTCAHGCENPTWTAWDGGQFPEAGHYYLTGDVTLEARISVGKNICLDLCGHTVTGPSNTDPKEAANSGEVFRAYSGAQFALMDSVGGGKVKAVGKYTAAGQGGNIYVGKGGTKLSAYNVEITGGQVILDGKDYGGNIYVEAGGEAYFKNCKITNGTAGDVNSKDDAGGNIFAKGNVTLIDCTVSGGTAGRAGNIHVEGTKDAPSKLIISGDTQIVNGKVGDNDGSGSSSVRAGGYCEISIVDGVEIDALSLAAGSKLNMFGGEVGTINVRHGDASLHNIYGGTIEVLEGNNHKYVTIHNAMIKNVNTDGIKAEEGYGQATVAACATQMALGQTGMLVAHAEGKCGTCGHTFAATACETCGAVHASMAGEIKLPWDGTSNIESGNYCLDKDVTVSGEVAIKGSLDLNGFTLTVSGKVDASAGNITDGSGKGKLVGADKVTLNAENKMLPLTAGENTLAFESVTLKQGYFGGNYKAGADTVSYAFYVNKAAAKTQVNEALAAGTLKLEVYVKWNNGTADVEEVFNLTDEMIAAYAQDGNWNGKMLCLNLKGLSKVTLLECNARLVSNGVTID